MANETIQKYLTNSLSHHSCNMQHIGQADYRLPRQDYVIINFSYNKMYFLHLAFLLVNHGLLFDTLWVFFTIFIPRIMTLMEIFKILIFFSGTNILIV